MKKIYLMLVGLCLSCNLYADTMLDGEDMNKTVLTIKKKLKIPYIISENISATNMYAEDNKYVVTEYTYDKPIFENKIVEARKSTKKNMLDTICYEKEARDVYCDFYIPTGKVYIEYWGYENDEKYLNRKKKKKEIYEKYNLNLIELEDKDVQNLDDVLPKYLLTFGIETF